MPKELIPYSLFLLLFIFLNVAIYFIIQLNAKEKVFRELFFYWISVLFVLISEGIVIKGRLGLSLIFIVNFLPISVMASFILRTYNYKFKFKIYAVAIPLAAITTIFLDKLNAPFQLTSAPIVMVTMAPFFEALYISLVLHRRDAGVIEKIIGVFLSFLGIFCCVNYGLNRFDPTPLQFIFGFGSAFVCYLLYSILLPLYCIQQINRKKTDFLENIVSDRTRELSESKQEKENLLRVLVHDISNPLQAAMYKTGTLKKSLQEESVDYENVEKILKSLNSIRDIITHVREYECVLSGTRTMELGEVLLQDCLDEVEQIFGDRFREKNISLKIHNKLSPVTKIKIDKTSFIHSVASNLVSNALKFSRPNSEVLIVCYLENSQIVIEVIDRGIGIAKESLDKIFDIGIMSSSNGTLGELGTGFGLPIVKAYAIMFGGRIAATSSQDSETGGTTFSLYLPQIENSSQDQIYLQ
jgi:nitrogen-specific signal transduction histidine kinase